MKVLNTINNFLKRLNNDHIGEYTAQCAYFSFLSFIPFILVLLSLIKYMNISTETLTFILDAILPSATTSTIFNIIQEIYSKSFQVISISAIFTLWSAANSFYSLSLGLSAIYKTEKENNHILLRIKGIIGTIVIIFSIIMALVLLVFGNTLKEIIEERFQILSGIAPFILKMRTIIVIIALFFVFLLLYRFVPGKKRKYTKKSINWSNIYSY